MSLSIWCKTEGMILNRTLILISLVGTDLIKMDSAVGIPSMVGDVVEEEVTNVHVRYVENMDT